MSDSISIILSDDHPLLRKGLKDIIEEHEAWHVVGEASDGERTLELIEQCNPDIMIIDIDMPKLNGLEVARIVKKRKLAVGLIILTMYEKETFFNRAMDLGVMGYVIKDSAATEIVDAIKSVAAGKYYISPSISGFLVKRGQYASDDAVGISLLTATERRVLKMVAENMTTKDIANELFIGIRTVETHRLNICQKLNLHGTNALLRFALAQRDVL